MTGRQILATAWCALIIIAAIALVAKAWGAETLTGRITAVEDGDTIEFRTDAVGDQPERCLVVRMADYDSPEIAHRPSEPRLCNAADAAWPPIVLPGQPGGKEATDALIRMVAAGGMRGRAACYEIDRYGRAVCTIWVNGSNVSVNRRMVAAGWGFTFSNPAWQRDKTAIQLEELASSQNRGLWAIAPGWQPSPSEWRRRCWGAVLDGRSDWADRCPGAWWP